MDQAAVVTDDLWRSEVTQIITSFMRERLSKRGYQWSVPPLSDVTSAIGSDHLLLNQAMNLIADTMLKENETTIRDMSRRAVTQNILDYASFKVIADEMFTEGVQWSHIVMLMLFGSELAYVLGVVNDNRQNNESNSFVNQVNEWLIQYFSSSRSLRDWILIHGRWNGLIAYAGLSDRRISNSVLLLAIGSVVTVTLATAIHYYIKA
jgi:hypothetical protein